MILETIKLQLKEYLESSLKGILPEDSSLTIDLEIPMDTSHGDLSSNIALKSAKLLKKPPFVIAEEFVKHIEQSLPSSSLKKIIQKVEVKKPGFINFFVSPQAFYAVLEEIYKRQEKYGNSDFGKKAKVQIEFVSANPTGPLTIAHARQAAVGDALGNILSEIGFAVTKEYYVNDQGNQINILGQSIRLRGLEILGETIQFPEDHYQGAYIKEMAKEYISKNKIKDAEGLKKEDIQKLKVYGAEYLMEMIRKDLKDFHVAFDTWSYESKIATPKTIQDVIDFLRSRGFIYDKEGAVWFESTKLGDDKDRVVQKSDQSFTYLAPDIVYHKNKFERGFKHVINIWGPDHHGYIPRIKAACQALGQNADALDVLIVQLATLYRNGQELSMSTRRGEFVSLREVLEEVGADAARYFFLMRSIKAHLDFDLELAKKQTPENPVYYIQYAHARVHSINKKAKEAGLKAVEKNFSKLDKEEEIALIKKMGAFPDTLKFCHTQLDPFPLVTYMLELAICFHRFYDKYKVIDEDKELSAQRLGLVNAARLVLSNGLRLLGLSAPESM